jgi:hypothetical protein
MPLPRYMAQSVAETGFFSSFPCQGINRSCPSSLGCRNVKAAVSLKPSQPAQVVIRPLQRALVQQSAVRRSPPEERTQDSLGERMWVIVVNRRPTWTPVDGVVNL